MQHAERTVTIVPSHTEAAELRRIRRIAHRVTSFIMGAQSGVDALDDFVDERQLEAAPVQEPLDAADCVPSVAEALKDTQDSIGAIAQAITQIQGIARGQTPAIELSATPVTSVLEQLLTARPDALHGNPATVQNDDAAIAVHTDSLVSLLDAVLQAPTDSHAPVSATVDVAEADGRTIQIRITPRNTGRAHAWADAVLARLTAPPRPDGDDDEGVLPPATVLALHRAQASLHYSAGGNAELILQFPTVNSVAEHKLDSR